jgi:hypothetical protein
MLKLVIAICSVTGFAFAGEPLQQDSGKSFANSQAQASLTQPFVSQTHAAQKSPKDVIIARWASIGLWASVAGLSVLEIVTCIRAYKAGKLQAHLNPYILVGSRIITLAGAIGAAYQTYKLHPHQNPGHTEKKNLVYPVGSLAVGLAIGAWGLHGIVTKYDRWKDVYIQCFNLAATLPVSVCLILRAYIELRSK